MCFAAAGVSVLRSSDEVLSAEDYEQLFHFVYSSQRPLAAAAGELVFSRYLTVNSMNEANKAKCVFLLSVSCSYAMNVQETFTGH